MPRSAPYDLETSTRRILDVLDVHSVTAVFFVLGKLAEERSDIVSLIASRGHEIALHGYRHEHLDHYDGAQLQGLAADLSRVAAHVESLTGRRPVGFRSPYLMAPAFQSPQLYAILKECGFKWVSNRSIRHERELLMPGRLPGARFLLAIPGVRMALFVLLNWRFICTDTVTGATHVTPFANLRWLLDGARPFARHGLIEVPAHAPFDCEIVGTPMPQESTRHEILEYGIESFSQNAREARGYYNVTFHDWISGSGVRLNLLEQTLARTVDDKMVRVIVPRTMTFSL
jgi:peptidoglycan/xylan/chitin deacetylase (PgdA/CDA1 family)